MFVSQCSNLPRGLFKTLLRLLSVALPEADAWATSTIINTGKQWQLENCIFLGKPESENSFFPRFLQVAKASDLREKLIWLALSVVARKSLRFRHGLTLEILNSIQKIPPRTISCHPCWQCLYERVSGSIVRATRDVSAEWIACEIRGSGSSISPLKSDFLGKGFVLRKKEPTFQCATRELSLPGQDFHPKLSLKDIRENLVSVRVSARNTFGERWSGYLKGIGIYPNLSSG